MKIKRNEQKVSEYEFYIPVAIWDHEAVIRFRQQLLTLAEGATTFDGLKGVWRGESEETMILRLILDHAAHELDGIQSKLNFLIESLLHELEATPYYQKSFIFTANSLIKNTFSLMR